MREDFERRVHAVDWSAYPGGHGPSTGANDVAGMLVGLMNGEPDEDLLLTSHVWHQGTIWPVSAKVVPFLWDLLLDADLESDLATEPEFFRYLRQAQWLLHQSALKDAQHGPALLNATLHRLGDPAEWTVSGELWSLIRLVVPQWRTTALAELVDAGRADDSHWVLLGHCAELPAAVIDTAAKAVMGFCSEALFVAARTPAPSKALQRALHSALRRLSQFRSCETPKDELTVWYPQFPAFDPFALADEWTPEHEVSLLFIGSGTVTLSINPAADVVIDHTVVFRKGAPTPLSVRVLPNGAVPGKPMRAGFHPNGRVSVLEWEVDDGRRVRAYFDLNGEPR